MIPILLLFCIAAIKVFKKTAPNGKITVYLGKRDFIDPADPIDGIVVVENDYLKGRKIFGQLTTTYRYGREEDEVMGLKFSKELILAREQIAPASVGKENLTPVQQRLIKKFPTNAFPFAFNFPANAPCSVTLQPGDESTGKPLGVSYSIKCMVGENEEEKPQKRSTVALVIKKLQYAPAIETRRLPSSVASKDFTFGSGKLKLEVTIDKELYHHGEGLGINVAISNTSRKPVKNIKCFIVQHCEVTMISAHYSREVASLETREGCPITTGCSFFKKFSLVPLASSNKNKFGVALDGYLKDEDVNLASSTLTEDSNSLKTESLGIVISYSVRVKLNCGTLGGELVTDVPFKLMHPSPEEAKMKTLKKTKSVDTPSCDENCDDNIIFEDFNKRRMSVQQEE